jgi:methyltransferase
MQYHRSEGKTLLIHPSFVFLLFLLFFTILLRLYELKLAKANYANRSKTQAVTLVAEPYYFLFFLLHGSFLVFVPLEVFFMQRLFHPIIAGICFVAFLLALTLRFHILHVLGKNWNVKIIHNPSAETITTHGIYQYIRHPNYLVVILEIASLSMFHHAYISCILYSILNFILLYFRIRKEEEALFKNSMYRKHFINKSRFFPGIF